MMSAYLHSGLAGAALVALMPHMALAQEASSASNGEIIVTAMKRGQNLQEIPAAISTVSGEELQSRGLTNIEDIASAVPNLNFGEHTGTTLITIRGVGSTVDSGVTEPTVATYVDGVFLPRATMALLRAVDIDRIEVLRGPQGTLYGRNATGGAVNFVSQAPSHDFTGAVTLSTGSRNAFGANGFVSGPIADGVYFRVSGGHEEEDGYVKVLNTGQRLGNTNVDYVRGALRFEPSADLSLDLSARYERSTSANAIQQALTPTFLPTPNQTIAKNKLYADAPFNGDVETLVLAGTVNWKFNDAISMRSITSYVDHKSKVSFDADATDIGAIYVTDFSRPSESFGQEINFLGDSDRFNWIVGLYYFEEKAGNSIPLGLGPVTDASYLVQTVDTKTKSFAAFVDGTYDLTDKLKINLGLRYNHEKKNFSQDLFLSSPAGVTVIAQDVKSRLKSNRVLPKVNLQYDVTDGVNLYAQWSRGFKSGGQNLPGGDGASLGAAGLYGSESLDAYEIGVKSQTADRRITANLAAFYYDYSDLQVTITIPPTTTFVQNAPARVYGVESEFSFRVTDTFRIDASANWLHARFRDFFSFDDAHPELGTQNLNGRALPHAPDFTARLAAEYRIEIPGDVFGDLTLRGDVNYSDRVVLRYFGTDNDSQKSYWQGNLSASLTSEDGKNTVRAFVNNVGNKLYLRNSTYLGAFGAYFGNYAPPRTWGVSATRKF